MFLFSGTELEGLHEYPNFAVGVFLENVQMSKPKLPFFV
jgi:hypothetical protein